MGIKTSIVEDIMRLMLGASFLTVALGFLALGVTWLPVIGILLALPFIFLGTTFLTERPYELPVKISIEEQQLGVLEHNALGTRGLIPVAILSTSRERGDRFDFDALTMDSATVSFGPKKAKPVDVVSAPEELQEHQRGTNAGGERDRIFYFPFERTGISDETKEVCIMGRTREGEIVRGCTNIHAAPA